MQWIDAVGTLDQDTEESVESSTGRQRSVIPEERGGHHPVAHIVPEKIVGVLCAVCCVLHVECDMCNLVCHAAFL